MHQPTQIIIILCSARRRESAFSFIIILTLQAKWSSKIVFTTWPQQRGHCMRGALLSSQACNFLASFAQENEREFATFCAKLTPTGDGQLFDVSNSIEPNFHFYWMF